MSPKTKVALVTNIPAPYRVPLYNEVARQLGDEGVGFTVIFAATGYPFRTWKVDMDRCRFDHLILNSRPLAFGSRRRVTFLYGGLGAALREKGADVVLVSGFSPAAVRLWTRSFQSSRPYVIWSGAVAGPSREHSAVRMVVRRLLVGRAAGFVAYGTTAREYLEDLGAPPQRIEIALNTTDIAFIRDETERYKRDSPKKDDAKRLLYVGNLERGKRVEMLLPIMGEVVARREDAILEIVGDGSEREQLESLAKDLGLEDKVRFEGDLPHAEVPRYLARADLFLFPSDYDIWGMALVEAMAAAVPCISSVRAGATRDLIVEGRTGFAVDFRDTKTVASRIRRLLDDGEEAGRIGEAGRALVSERASLEVSAAAMVRAALAAVGNG